MLYTPEYLRELLTDMNASKVAKACGLSSAVVIHLASGRADNPTADTLKRLTEYFQERGYEPTQEG